MIGARGIEPLPPEGLLPVCSLHQTPTLKILIFKKNKEKNCNPKRLNQHQKF